MISTTIVLRATVTASVATVPSSASVASAVAGGSMIPADTTPTSPASTPTAEATSATSGCVLMSDGLEPIGDLLVCFTKKCYKVTNDVFIVTVEECGGNTRATGTTSTTNAMNVVIDVGGKVIVDDMGDVGDIETTSSNGGGNHDGGATLAEGLEGRFALPSGSVTMNGHSRVAVGVEVVGECVGHPFRLHEHKR